MIRSHRLLPILLGLLSMAPFAEGQQPMFVGLPCNLKAGENIVVDGTLTSWIKDASPNNDSASDVYGYARGLIAGPISLDTRQMFATSASQGSGHWHGARIVDSPAESELDSMFGFGGIGGTPINPSVDIDQCYLAFSGSKIFFAIENRNPQPSCDYQIEFSQNAPLWSMYETNPTPGDILLDIRPNSQGIVSCTVYQWLYKWSKASISNIGLPVGVNIVQNQVATPSGPWGRIDSNGIWTTDPLAQHQLIEGSVEFSSLASGIASHLLKSKGAYVQFRTTPLDGNPLYDTVDITPIYGIALAKPVAVPYIERGTCTLTLNSDQSFGPNGEPIDSATWLLRIADKQPSTKTGFSIAQGDGSPGQCNVLTSNVAQLPGTSPLHLVFDAPQTYIDILVTLQVESHGVISRSPTQTVRIWAPITSTADIEGDFAFVDTAVPDWDSRVTYSKDTFVNFEGVYYVSMQDSNVGHEPALTSIYGDGYWQWWSSPDAEIFDLASLQPWSGPLGPITQHWFITIEDSYGDFSAITLDGPVDRYQPEPLVWPDFFSPYGVSISFWPYLTGGMDQSSNPYVSSYLSTMQSEFDSCGPPNGGFQPIVIRI